jgi:hypothetical protein
MLPRNALLGRPSMENVNSHWLLTPIGSSPPYHQAI